MKLIKTLILCLATILITQFLDLQAGAFGTSDDGLVYYERTITDYPVMNKATYKDAAFLSKYVGIDNNSVYNIAPAFEFYSGGGASSMPDNLTFGTTFKHLDNDNTYNVMYSYGFDYVMKPVLEKGDLYVCLTANLTNDKHWNASRHLKKKTAYPYTSIRTYNKQLISHNTSKYKNDSTQTLGKNHFVPVGSIDWYQNLYFNARGAVCTCGSSKVSYISIMLADVAEPKVTSIYTSRAKTRYDGNIEMEPYTRFKAGDALYINLIFDENIRFADDQAMALEDAPKLKFKMKRITDNIAETGISAEASLVSLHNNDFITDNSNALTFKYIVPETFSLHGDTVNTNYYIYEIEPYANQTSWVSSKKDFNLKLFGKNGSYLNESRKTTSLFVDLAGNPINIDASTVKLNAPAYMDNTVPKVTKLDIVRPDYTSTSTNDLDRSDVFVSIGEKIGFFVNFSEEMLFARNSDGETYPFTNFYYDHGVKLGYDMQNPFGTVNARFLAELNISRDGTPVTAVAKYCSTIRDGLNGPRVSRVYFETEEPVSADMVPTIFNDEQLPIGINRMYLELDPGKDYYDFADTRGNFYEEGTKFIDTPDGQRVMPARQLWLDTTNPTASTALVPETGGYRPVNYTSGDNPSAFYFQVEIADQDGYGEEYISLTNGANGAFMWRDNMANPVDYTYEYVVTGSADQPADSAYQPGLTGKKNRFTQIDTGNYIHIRLLDEVNYNIGDSDLVLYPVDYAKNVAEVNFPLDYEMDRAGPLITRDSYKNEYTSGDFGGAITTVIGVRDVSGLSTVAYQWTNLHEEPTSDNWSSAATTGDAITLVKDNLATDTHHQYTLHVRSTDVLEYSTSASFDFDYDLTSLVYNMAFITDPETILKKHSAKVFLPDNGTGTAPDGAADRIMVLIKKLGLDNEYWARSFSYTDICGVDNAVDVLDINDTTIGEWTSVIKTAGEVPEAGAAWIYTHTSLSDQQKTMLMNGFYEQLEVTVIARRPSIDYGETIIPYEEVRTEDVYTLNYANGDAINPSAKIHKATITALSKVTTDSYSTNPEVTDIIPSLPNPPTNLDGAVFTVSSLGNEQVTGYGLSDIDFESADTHFALYKIGAGETGVPLFTAPLIPKVSQDIAIPSGVTILSGNYKAVVSLKCKYSNHIDTWEYTDILIDRRKADNFGVTQVRTDGTIAGSIPLGQEAVTDYTISDDIYTKEVYVSTDPNTSHSLKFTAKLPALDLSTHSAYIKVWNATVSGSGSDLVISESSYRWVSYDGQIDYKAILLNEGIQGLIEDDLASDDRELAATIPIVPGENIITYQIATTTGYVSPEQTVLVQAGDDIPTIEMVLSPQIPDGSATKEDIVAAIQSLSSRVDSADNLGVGIALPPPETFEEGLTIPQLIEELSTNRKLTLSENGDYYFYVYDKYHNFGYQKVTIDYIDREGPSFIVTDHSDSEKNTFDFEIEIRDNFNTEDCKVYLGFDDAYSDILGVERGSRFEVPTTDWIADDVSQSGLYKTTVTENGDTKIINASGAFKYDSGGADLYRTIWLYAEDGLENHGGVWVDMNGQDHLEPRVYEFIFNPRNEPAEYISGEITDIGLVATFSKPVLLMEPTQSTPNLTYSHTKSNLPYSANGVYPILYSDVFGDQYKESIEVEAFDELYHYTVSFSETEPTNQDVHVLINAAFNPDVTLALPSSIAGGTITPVYNESGAAVGASVTMAQNGTITFGIVPNDSARPTRMRTIAIGNIDKTPPEVTLEWVYTADVIDGTTAGDLMVSLISDEELEPIMNTGTTHAFSFYDQEPYTFHYEDLAGNSGSLTATPPVAIVEKPLVEDDIPPDYDLAVYKSVDGAGIKVAGYSKEQYNLLHDKADAFPLFSGLLQLRFDVFDKNQTVLSIKDGPVEGVSVSGMNVTVSDNAEFVVVIRDAMDNFTEVPVSITKADNTSPTGAITYVRVDPLTIRGYLTMSDNLSETCTLKNTHGIQMDTSPGENAGKYFHEFSDNESFTFVFTDEAGNIGSVTAAVTSIDVTTPIGTISQWVPYFIDENGTEYKNQLSDTNTNSDVSVYIQFNKPIQSITPSIQDGIGNLENITLTHAEDNATVVFRQNAKVQLSYAATNTREGIMLVEVDIIDKTPPEITALKTASDAKSVTYSFTSDEEVFFEGEDVISETGRRELGTSFTKVLELNGSYDFKFTDRAGNTTIKHVDVIDEIDRVAPGVDVWNLPATKEKVDAYNLDNGTAIEHVVTNQSIVIEASMDEMGTLYFRGVPYPASADERIPLTITYNGTYEIAAIDLAGNTTRYRFRIDCIDKSKPQILLPGGNLFVRQGTTLADFETMALEKIHVTDNHDMSPAVTLSTSLDTDQLNTPGTHSIAFTASDTAGNSQTRNYFVQVYDRHALEVLINGELAQPGETLFIGGTRVISITVDNLPIGPGGTEPCRMYLRSGLNTPGQMKDAAPFSGSFTAPKDGFYTLYLMTQSKKSFITYIYVQE